MIKELLTARFDSIVNYLTGAGDPYRDKGLASRVMVDAPIDDLTLQGLITGNDLAYRVVSGLPNKALKEGFGLAAQDGVLEPKAAQEQAAELITECERLGIRDKLLEADAWGRGYGLAGLVLGVTGAGAPNTPLDDEKAGRLAWTWVVDKREVVPATYYNDQQSDKFGEVETYTVLPTSQQGTKPMTIHETRLVRFGGALTSRRERSQNAGCDYSVLQRALTPLKQAEGNWSSVCALMDDMSQSLYQIDGLWSKLASGGKNSINTELTAMDMMRSSRRSLVIDAKDKWERKVTPMGGVNEVIEQTWKRLAAAAEMPLTVLMGVSPAGMNATGESDLALWYDSVRAHQQHVLSKRIVRIVRLISRTLGHAHPEVWRVTWPSLYQMTALEKADHYLKTAQADKIYVDMGALLPEEVALSRFASGEDFDGATTTIDADTRKAALKLALADMKDPPEPTPPLPAGQRGALPPASGATEPSAAEERDAP